MKADEVAPQYYVRKKHGKSHRYHKADPFEGLEVVSVEALNLTEWNKKREEFHKTDRNAGCSARVLCPTCEVRGEEVLMVYATETILSNAGNMPAMREVQCNECGRTGKMLL